MLNQLETKIGELVRDLTLVGFPHPKSAIRKRINELLELQRQMIVHKVIFAETQFTDWERDRFLDIIKSIK